MADTFRMDVSLGRLKGADERLERAQLEFVGAIAGGLTDEIRKRIRSRSSRLAGSWRGRAVSTNLAIVESTGTRYGRASVHGNYIRPVRRRALAFRTREGRLVFRAWSRYSSGAYVGDPRNRNTGYVTRAMRMRRQIGQAALEQTIGRSL